MSDQYPSDWDSRRRRVYRRDGYQCQNCGAIGGKAGAAELHAHHGVPISKGGTHDLSNLTTYCKDCHNAIHHKNTYAPTATQHGQSYPSLTDQQASIFAIGLVSIFVLLALLLFTELMIFGYLLLALIFIFVAVLVLLEPIDYLNSSNI